MGHWEDFYQNGTTRFTPSFMTHYSLYSAQNYRETGAGGANLNVNSKSLEIFELGTNFELGWDFKLGNEKRFSPEIRAGYRYDLVGDRFREPNHLLPAMARQVSTQLEPILLEAL